MLLTTTEYSYIWKVQHMNIQGTQCIASSIHDYCGIEDSLQYSAFSWSCSGLPATDLSQSHPFINEEADSSERISVLSMIKLELSGNSPVNGQRTHHYYQIRVIDEVSQNIQCTGKFPHDFSGLHLLHQFTQIAECPN